MPKSLENLDLVIEQLKHNKLKLIPFDLVMSTLPCTDESRLKSLNKYSDTLTIHLFRKSEFVRITKPHFVLVEMVAPLVDHFEPHEAVLQEHNFRLRLQRRWSRRAGRLADPVASWGRRRRLRRQPPGRARQLSQRGPVIISTRGPTDTNASQTAGGSANRPGDPRGSPRLPTKP